MSALARPLPATLVAGIAAVATASLIHKNVSNARQLLTTAVHGGTIGRALILAFVLANIKCLPFVWHLRVFKAILQHAFPKRKFSPTSSGPAALFQPLITTSRAPALDCDYNMHKSNSSYFADLDVSRASLVCSLCSKGFEVVFKETADAAEGRHSIPLGSVACTFRREIRPFQAYEVWSRILCWDRKWLYIVSHFVRKGAVRPKGYVLQQDGSLAWLRKAFRRPGGMESRSGRATADAPPIIPDKDIYASALSRYVCKKGRLTIAPERILAASGLLPPRPEASPSDLSSGSLGVEQQQLQSGNESIQPATAPTDLPTTVIAAPSVDAAPAPSSDDEEKWDWERVEAERQRGMKIAEMMLRMEELPGTFTGASDKTVLGQYRDLL